MEGQRRSSSGARVSHCLEGTLKPEAHALYHVPSTNETLKLWLHAFCRYVSGTGPCKLTPSTSSAPSFVSFTDSCPSKLEVNLAENQEKRSAASS